MCVLTNLRRSRKEQLPYFPHAELQLDKLRQATVIKGPLDVMTGSAATVRAGPARQTGNGITLIPYLQ